MSGDESFNFSFSGLKTAVVNLLKTNEGRIGAGITVNDIAKNGDWQRDSSAVPVPDFSVNKITVNDIAASFQEAAVDVLVEKTVRAAVERGAKSVWLAGGVAANSLLRLKMKKKSDENGFSFSCPPLKYCTDNAAMVAMAGYWISRENRPGLPLSPSPGCSL